MRLLIVALLVIQAFTWGTQLKIFCPQIARINPWEDVNIEIQVSDNNGDY